MDKNLTVVGYFLTAMLERPDLCAPAQAELVRYVVEVRGRGGASRRGVAKLGGQGRAGPVAPTE